ncbi:MAG: 16S rRNA (guanine(966)-N(2))-methyltransferase RsmD [Smithellaceae bacterium]
MRITGGEAKGRTLKFPPGSVQRPTSDFLRQALFNMLQSVEGQLFLDLFAGSGAVGLEAASRKAASVVLVEKSKLLAAVIADNIALCRCPDVCTVIHADVSSALRNLYEKGIRFDVIFADPPYSRGLIRETFTALMDYPLLKTAGILVFQHSNREQQPSMPEGWFMFDQRQYGDNLLTFIRVAEHGNREI